MAYNANYPSPSPGEREAVKIYGLHPLTEALDAGQDLERVMMRKGLNGEQARVLMGRLRAAGVPIQYVPDVKLNMFTGADRHQGCVAFVSPVQYHKLEDVVMGLFERGETPLLMFPAGVTDVRNLGSIARTAECMGVHAMILPTANTARINADSLKTSAGALFHLPVCRVPGYGPALDYLKHSGIQIVGCFETGEFRLRDINLTIPTCLVLGGEEEGIPEPVLSKCDATCRIPMMGQIGSLNVAVASGMLLYEAQRQRN